mgnify:FL=1
MAYITKRGSSYSVRYTYQDEHGKSCDKWESFPTKEDAVKRQRQIEHADPEMKAKLRLALLT